MTETRHEDFEGTGRKEGSLLTPGSGTPILRGEFPELLLDARRVLYRARRKSTLAVLLKSLTHRHWKGQGGDGTTRNLVGRGGYQFRLDRGSVSVGEDPAHDPGSTDLTYPLPHITPG